MHDPGGDGTTPVTTACPQDRWGQHLRIELESKGDDQHVDARVLN